MWIYVLKLRDDCWYVGSSKHPEKRYKQHVEGKGAQWTRLHPPLSLQIVSGSSNHKFEELTQTLCCMQKYGIEKVRGDIFVQTVLPPHQLQVLHELLYANQNACFRCGSTSHWIQDCPQQQQQQPTNRTDYSGLFLAILAMVFAFILYYTRRVG